MGGSGSRSRRDNNNTISYRQKNDSILLEKNKDFISKQLEDYPINLKTISNITVSVKPTISFVENSENAIPQPLLSWEINSNNRKNPFRFNKGAIEMQKLPECMAIHRITATTITNNTCNVVLTWSNLSDTQTPSVCSNIIETGVQMDTQMLYRHEYPDLLFKAAVSTQQICPVKLDNVCLNIDVCDPQISRNIQQILLSKTKQSYCIAITVTLVGFYL